MADDRRHCRWQACCIKWSINNGQWPVRSSHPLTGSSDCLSAVRRPAICNGKRKFAWARTQRSRQRPATVFAIKFIDFHLPACVCVRVFVCEYVGDTLSCINIGFACTALYREIAVGRWHSVCVAEQQKVEQTNGVKRQGKTAWTDWAAAGRGPYVASVLVPAAKKVKRPNKWAI